MPAHSARSRVPPIAAALFRAVGRGANPLHRRAFQPKESAAAKREGRKVMGELDGEVAFTWPGCNCRGLCTTANSVELSFPLDAGLEARAALLAAALLLHYVYMEI
eukprot:SAG22_NODE_201_length_15391_cov_7.662176_12_plen_106_part_00